MASIFLEPSLVAQQNQWIIMVKGIAKVSNISLGALSIIII